MSIDMNKLFELYMASQLFNDDGVNNTSVSPLHSLKSKDASDETLNEVKDILLQLKNGKYMANNDIDENAIQQIVKKELSKNISKPELPNFDQLIDDKVINKVNEMEKRINQSIKPLDEKIIIDQLKEEIQKDIKKLHSSIDNEIEEQKEDLKDYCTQQIENKFKKIEKQFMEKLNDAMVTSSKITLDNNEINQVTGQNDSTKDVIGNEFPIEYNKQALSEDQATVALSEKEVKDKNKKVEKDLNIQPLSADDKVTDDDINSAKINVNEDQTNKIINNDNEIVDTSFESSNKVSQENEETKEIQNQENKKVKESQDEKESQDDHGNDVIVETDEDEAPEDEIEEDTVQPTDDDPWAGL